MSAILDDVRRRGDAALRELTARFDGADLADPWVTADELAGATVEPALEAALADAASAIGRYHAEQRNALRAERPVRTAPGVTAWRRWQPIERAGGYVPGGRAAYASSVLMLAVPARLAGVGELILATPPGRDGSVAAPVLVAARIGGVDRILKAGGAQAIAALAYGTASVPAVDKIFGAGNAWVTAAKRAVASRVAIDLPAGPSECIVLADGGADAELVALDLLAQAEHGPDSVAIVVSDDAALLDAVDAALERVAGSLATGERALATVRAPRRGHPGRRPRGGPRCGERDRGRARQPAVRRRRCARRRRAACRRGVHRSLVADRGRRLRDRHEPHPADGRRGASLERRRRRVVRPLDRGPAPHAGRRPTRVADGRGHRGRGGPAGARRQRAGTRRPGRAGRCGR